MLYNNFINKAKYILFKDVYKTNPFNEDKEYIKLIKDNDCIIVGDGVAIYDNDHHYVVPDAYEKILPIICDTLQIDYNKDDFYLVKNIIDGKDYSYFLPKNDIAIKCYAPSYRECDDGVIIRDADFYGFFNGKYSQMVNVLIPYNRDDLYKIANGVISAYHRLFAFPHQCCIIENNGGNDNGKTLLISNDSHMIPFIPILCYYYKKVISLDNRFDSSCKIIYEKENVDDVLIAPSESSPLWKYTVKNFR